MNLRLISSRHDTGEAGMTVMELVIFSALSLMVLTVAGGVFISSIQTNSGTRARDTATGMAQITANSLQTSIRNASEFQVTDAGSPTTTGNRVTARVAPGTDDAWEGRSWEVTADGDLVYSRTTADGTPIEPAMLASEVAGTLPGHQTFAVAPTNDRHLQVGFTVTVGDAVVPVTTSVIAQAAGEGAIASC